MEKIDDFLISLNKDPLTDFSIQKLEDRLETDPLYFGNPLDGAIQLDAECFTCNLCFSCGEFM